MNGKNEENAVLSECLVCGQKISSSAEVCPHCGQKTSVGNKKEEEKNKVIISIVTMVLTVVAAILVMTSMPISRSTEGTFILGIMLFAVSIGIDIGMYIRSKKGERKI